MEKVCEFCKALKPVVYCNSDTAHLCLSCDAKVHSANALSYRHPRTLVCESCRFEPAHVRCFVHELFLCQSCDTSHHVSIQHQKIPVSSYVGCPSAKDLAVLWGFDLNQLESKCTESEEGSSSHRMKVVKNDNQQQNTCSVLQQIQDLERNHHLYEGIDPSCLVHVKDRTNGLSFKQDTVRKVQETLDNQMEHFYRHLEFQHVDIPQDETTEETYLSPFSQLDPLTSSENSLHGDSFWECKSPDNEIWLQNMQDLGVCDEVKSLDDVNIPEVDLTFRNFEEIFGSEHELSRTLVDDKNIKAFSSSEMFSWSGKLERGCSSKIEKLQPGSWDSDTTRLDGKENVIMRYKEKKILRREKQANIHPRNLNRMARSSDD